MSKQSIRDELLLRRKSQESSEQQRRSRLVQERLLATAEFRRATSVALYSPVHGEVLTNLLADEVLRLGKRLIYPRIRDRMLEFVAIASREALHPGHFGIPEPLGGITVELSEIDLLVVPGVVFDHAGHRIGYGKGFYDRLLHGAGHGCKAGIAYDFQLVAALPVEKHDVQMDLLVTECVLLRWPCGRSSSLKL